MAAPATTRTSSVPVTNDTVTEIAGEGTADLINSTITRSLADYANVENLDLFETDQNGNPVGPVNGFGNALLNYIYGNSAANLLNGAANVDYLYGEGGDDTYELGGDNDIVVENVGEGTDTITSTNARSLVPFGNVENLTLIGANLNGTGNALANTITGTAGANMLKGGGGLDMLIGGGGNDTYDAGQRQRRHPETTGIDTVTSTISRSLAGAAFNQVEKLTLLGSATIGTGNAQANTIIGNNGKNKVSTAASATTSLAAAAPTP